MISQVKRTGVAGSNLRAAVDAKQNLIAVNAGGGGSVRTLRVRSARVAFLLFDASIRHVRIDP